MYTKTAVQRIASLLGATAGCVLLAGNVMAGDHNVTESYHVNTRGLDLSQPADVQTLYTRLQNAAWFVCARGMRADLVPVEDFKGCYEKSLGDAVRTIKRTMVTQIYLATHTRQEAERHGIEVPAQVASK